MKLNFKYENSFTEDKIKNHEIYVLETTFFILLFFFLQY